MVVMTPADENECRQMLSAGLNYNGPVAVRYPRGKGPGVTVNSAIEDIAIGRAVQIRQGKDIAFLALWFQRYTRLESSRRI